MTSFLCSAVRIVTFATVFPILTIIPSMAANAVGDDAAVHVAMKAERFDASAVDPAAAVIEAEPLIIPHGIGCDTSAFETAPLESAPLGTAPLETGDRLWLINTRQLSTESCRINLENPALSVSRLSCGGRATRSSIEAYLASSRPVAIYVHGNRMTSRNTIERGLFVYRHTCRCRKRDPIDWVIWSWPSEKHGFLAKDARRKAERTDAQGLYLAWLLRKHAETSRKTALIGFSFGGRIVTGSLHALAGGALGRRRLPGEPISGVPFEVGLVAPAIESHWLTTLGYHKHATKNMEQLLLLYNRRDAVLKNYWRIERVRNVDALGYSGPTAFGPRADGSRLPVRSKDCAPSIGLRHDEEDYYKDRCRAGNLLGSLINVSAN